MILTDTDAWAMFVRMPGPHRDGSGRKNKILGKHLNNRSWRTLAGTNADEQILEDVVGPSTNDFSIFVTYLVLFCQIHPYVGRHSYKAIWARPCGTPHGMCGKFSSGAF